MGLSRWVVTLSFCLAAAAKSPLTHETMWSMKRVGAPVASPNGKWIVVSVVEPAYDPKEQVSDLWIVPADGSAEPRRLTYTKGAESGVEWSADSNRIAFSSKREGDEDAQVYVLDLTGGEAQRVTSQSGGASGPKFSPDGRRILFQSAFDPIAAGRKSRKYNVRAYDSFPVRLWDHWLDEKRPHLFVQDLTPGSKAKDLFEASKLASGPGFDGQAANSGSDLQPAWTPDGGSIVFVATANRNQAAYAPVITSLYLIAANGGEPERLTNGHDSFANPLFAPDGKALYALYDREDVKVYHLSRLARISWPGRSSPEIVSANLDRSIATFGVARDGKTLYALCEEHGHVKLFSIPGGLAVDLDQGLYANLSAAGGVLVANYHSSISPPEVVRIDVASKSHRALTSFNSAKAAEIDWQPPKHFWFTSKTTGRKIHNILFLPPAFNAAKKYPLVQFIHGGAHAMSSDEFHTRWNYHLLTAPGYAVLTTNYTGSTGFGEQFAQSIQLDPFKGPGAELNEAVDEALRQFPFLDKDRLAAGGASYGGHLANWLQATTTRFKCLFSHAGLINLESQWGTSDAIYHREVGAGGPVWEQGKVWREQNPIRYAASFKTPILLSVGENDFRVPLNQTLENWSVLQRLNIPSRLLVFPEENHWILKGEDNRYFFQELTAWLAKWL